MVIKSGKFLASLNPASLTGLILFGQMTMALRLVNLSLEKILTATEQQDFLLRALSIKSRIRLGILLQ